VTKGIERRKEEGSDKERREDLGRWPNREGKEGRKMGYSCRSCRRKERSNAIGEGHVL